MDVNERMPGSWLELHDLLFDRSWQEELGRHRSDFAFRGCSDARYRLSSSLLRLGGKEAGELEGHLIRNFRKYAARHDVPADSPWNWLALAQHHGLPTRLLDWTFSPYVALHFVTCNVGRFDRDGAVWMVDYAEAHRLLPERLRRVLEDEGANVFTTEMLGRVAPDLADLAEPGEEFALFVEPPSFDERIVNQYALCALVSRPDLPFGEWLRRHPDVWRKVVVPAELKWEVRDKLDQANITERVLVPGLDGLSAWLSRFYLRRPAEERSAAGELG